MPKMDHYQADVLVLGAGAAGLAAARELSKKHHVIVLEARNRVGGRINTIRPPGAPLPIELGPEFIHGKAEDTFEILREGGLIAYDVLDRHWEATTQAPREKPFWEKVEQLMARMGKVGRKDASFEQFLATHARGFSAEAKRMATMYVEGFNAARKEEISVLSLKRAEEDTGEDDRELRLIGGYDQIPSILARSICPPSRIDLSTVITRVKWQPGSVEVTASRATELVRYRGRLAIIALPLGVLQSSNKRSPIYFDPPLPVQKLLDEQLRMGPVTKIIMQFQDPFWETRDKDMSFIHSEDVPFRTWWTTFPLRTNLLTGWAGGPVADPVGNDDQAILQHAIHSLAEIFRIPQKRITDQLRGHWFHNWQTDPWSMGAYSYAAVGGAFAPDKLAKPIANTLFIAGEHTHGLLLGTVSGAIHSGKHAAQLALQRLN